MGVQVLDVVREQAGLLQRLAHRPRGAFAVLVRLGDMEGVAGGAVAGEFSEDACTAGDRVLFGFEHQQASAFAHHEAIARLVEGPRGGRRVIVAGSERLGGGEAGHRNRRDRRFRAAREGDFRVAATDDVCRFTDAVRTAGAGADKTVVHPARAKLDAQLAAGHVRKHHRHEEGADP